MYAKVVYIERENATPKIVSCKCHLFWSVCVVGVAGVMTYLLFVSKNRDLPDYFYEGSNRTFTFLWDSVRYLNPISLVYAFKPVQNVLLKFCWN